MPSWRKSDLHSRSVAGQIIHRLRLGRAIRQSGSCDHARVTAASARPDCESKTRLSDCTPHSIGMQYS
ncbi:hypothetical protein GL284_15570 [Paracoccus sp. DK608]|uniref:Uncharacterized protein n=1 Tax=Paracoccus shanxieyensis TaxID=2675752 RepID=A0A6L6J362_9RHOB|nr:hypothetical protein [Paracoccus shanxieyensis]MTH65690.1 hypothetical protein [Paracoccus shanxieyensis]MTH88735.1 hypothetical protein [Paracoccus shanxieyensis]